MRWIRTDSAELGFDWYLGQFEHGQRFVAKGGTSASLNVPDFGGFSPGDVSRFIGGQHDCRFPRNSCSPAVWATVPSAGHHHRHPDRSQFPCGHSCPGKAHGYESSPNRKSPPPAGGRPRCARRMSITIVTGFSFQQAEARPRTTTTTRKFIPTRFNNENASNKYKFRFGVFTVCAVIGGGGSARRRRRRWSTRPCKPPPSPPFSK